MKCARVVLALVLLSLPASAEERRVRIRLSDGTVIEATLVDFGSRTYRFRIEGEIKSYAEEQIAEIDFRPGAAPPVAVTPPEAAGEGALIVNDADLRSTLESLAQRHGLSLVLGPTVRGTVSAYIPEGSPRAVIEAIAAACNYRVEEANGILALTPAVVQLPWFDPPAGGGAAATLDVKDADIRQVLPMLAKAAGCSVVCGPTVRGTVTLRFNAVPAYVALESAAAAVNCGLFATKAGILLVSPALPRDRVTKAGTPSPETEVALAELRREVDHLRVELARLQASPYTERHPTWKREAEEASRLAEENLKRAEALIAKGVIAADQVIEAKEVLLDARLAAGFIPPEEWDRMRLDLLKEAARMARARFENGLGNEIEAIRAEFRVVQLQNSLELVQDAEFEKRCAEALAKEKAIREAQLKAGMLTPEELAASRIEMFKAIDLYRALPKEKKPEKGPEPKADTDPVEKMVTDAFYQRPENRFELRPRWNAQVEGLYGCAGQTSAGESSIAVYASTAPGEMLGLGMDGKVQERWSHAPGMLRIVDIDGNEGGTELITIQNFMFGTFDVWDGEDWSKKRWSGQSKFGGLNVPQVADLDGDGDMEVFVAAYGGGGLQVFDTDGKEIYAGEDDISGACIARRPLGRALFGYDFGDGVKELSALTVLGRIETKWPVKHAKAIGSGDLDGDGTDEVVLGEGAEGWIDGKDFVVARSSMDGKELWRYELPQGFALREPNAIVVEDLDGDKNAEVLVSLSPGMLTREGDKVYHCFLCLIDSKGRPAWISEPFEEVGKTSMGSFCVGLSACDLDGDGDKEVILGVLDRGVHVFDVVR